MALSVEKKITLWFILTLGITFYFTYLTFQSKIDYYNRGEWVKLSYNVQAEIQRINGFMQQMEICSHHYLVTGRQAYLTSYRNALDSMDNSILHFAKLTGNNPRQMKLSLLLSKINYEKISKEHEQISRRNYQQFLNTADREFENSSEILIDSLRSVMNMMDFEEDKLLEERIQAQEAASRKATTTLAVMISISLLALGAFYFIILDDVKKRRKTELQLPNAINKFIHVKNALDKDINVFADLNMASTILRNLISNAIKFTERGGEIIISGRKNGGFAEIKVTDSGIGMSEDVKNKIFRIDSIFSAKGTEGEEGSGLGLELCRELAISEYMKINYKGKQNG